MKIPVYAVRIPRGLNAPHGNTVRFATRKDRDHYLKRCCGDCKPITIPVTR